VDSAVDTRHSNTSPPASNAKTPAATSQPDPKLNSVAHEVAVVATGARPGKAGGQRELFTEETTTVLVFENGGVLRLAAAVVPGQLLFLTNKGTRREVVAQVTRKRDFRPASCYVEVEFSEPSPGFWGIDFPETPQLVPATVHQKEAAELVHSAKIIPGKPSAPAPTTHEVTALKQEVEALREQLKLLQTQTATTNSSAPVNVPVPAAIPDPPPAPAVTEAHAEPSPHLPSAAPEVPASEPATVHSGPASSAPPVSAALPIEPGGPSFSEALHAPMPVIRISRASSSAKSSAKSNEATGANFRAKPLLITLLSAAALLAAFGTTWYLHWIPGLAQPKPVSAGAPSVPAAQPASTSSTALPKTANAANPINSTPPAESKTAAQPAPKADAAQLAAAGESPAPSTLVKAELAAPADAAVVPAAVQKKSALAVSTAERSAPRPSIKTASASAALPSQGSASIVSPKLIKSVRAIASPNALEYFAHDRTATVTLDAVVDISGRVKSMKVLSGPASLRDSAINALKQYRYEPATLRGKPVPAHVTVPIKFLFEP
jgi:protein TonB